MTRSSSSRVFTLFLTGRLAELFKSVSVLDRPFHDVRGCTAKLVGEHRHIEVKRKLTYPRKTWDRISCAPHCRNALDFSRGFEQIELPRLFRPAANLVQRLIRNKL